MRPFSYAKAISARAAIEGADADAAFLAGGTELMQLMREGAAAPARLIDITALPETGVSVEGGALRLGALARLSDVAADPAVRRGCPAIAEALLASASPQVRNAATIGGNLMQRTRCPYFRDAGAPCNKRAPGSGCGAREGDNRRQAVFGGSVDCVATHASDLAVALTALDATIEVEGLDGRRRIPVAEFYRLPGETPWRETALGAGELILAVEIPGGEAARRSVYLKLRDRAAFDFALVSVAASVVVRDGRIREARVAAGGVGTVPWRLGQVEEALAGRPATPETYGTAAERAGHGAEPLSQNGFKVELMMRTIRRALALSGGKR